MKQLHPFFIIGTVGMILTASLHILMALVLGIPEVHTTFYVLYSLFITFLTIGTALVIEKHKTHS